MPHNNRVSASAALRTNDIWSKTIGHDPYAAAIGDVTVRPSQEQNDSLRLLVKMSNVTCSESRGGCKKCGMLGHLTYQCQNNMETEIHSPTSPSDSEHDDEVKIPSHERKYSHGEVKKSERQNKHKHKEKKRNKKHKSI